MDVTAKKHDINCLRNHSSRATRVTGDVLFGAACGSVALGILPVHKSKPYRSKPYKRRVGS